MKLSQGEEIGKGLAMARTQMQTVETRLTTTLIIKLQRQAEKYNNPVIVPLLRATAICRVLSWFAHHTTHPQILARPRIRLQRIISLSQALARAQTQLSRPPPTSNPAAAAIPTWFAQAPSNEHSRKTVSLCRAEGERGFCSVWHNTCLGLDLDHATVWPWAYCITSLNLDTFIRTIRMIQAPPHRVIMRVETENMWLHNVSVRGKNYFASPAPPSLQFMYWSPHPGKLMKQGATGPMWL